MLSGAIRLYLNSKDFFIPITPHGYGSGTLLPSICIMLIFVVECLNYSAAMKANIIQWYRTLEVFVSRREMVLTREEKLLYIAFHELMTMFSKNCTIERKNIFAVIKEI